MSAFVLKRLSFCGAAFYVASTEWSERYWTPKLALATRYPSRDAAEETRKMLRGSESINIHELENENGLRGKKP